MNHTNTKSSLENRIFRLYEFDPFYIWFLEGRYILFNNVFLLEQKDKNGLADWRNVIIVQNPLELDPKSLLTFGNPEVRKKVKEYLGKD